MLDIILRILAIKAYNTPHKVVDGLLITYLQQYQRVVNQFYSTSFNKYRIRGLTNLLK
jgi:hypothetical protein